MQESGVDLEFDILGDILEEFQPKVGFYEIQSRTLDDVISTPTKNLGTGADAILSELFKPKENKMSLSRTQQKLQLQREHLLKQEQKKKEQERQRQLEQTSEISIPFPRPTETLPPHIPPAVLNFKTKLENPTKYYVYKTQERKLKEYINQHGGSAPSPGFTPPTSHATLNAINSMSTLPYVADGLGLAGATKPPDSPMSAASSTGASEVDEILDDIISLEGDAVANQMGLDNSFDFLDFAGTNATLALPAAASVSDIYNGRNVSAGPLQDAISTSCPPKIKQEPGEESCNNMEKFNHVTYLKDRQKKDNHNMIERRRRFNINDRIKELGTMIPKQDSDMKQNKGTILKCTVDYIKYLKKENERHKSNVEKFRETEELNSKLLLRIQELEMHCRAHNVPVTPLTNDTSTATLSALLSAKRISTLPNRTIKTEKAYRDDSAACSMNTDSYGESGDRYDNEEDVMET
ncbi:transcription factor E3-like isoform X2 [Dendronephthya gigantea]|uniref:transcription factor E3-like isoform X2 n=1 Tax=Dendronephthya gigantea TaxID=151771 RepID=UPI00106DBC1A|nr:transcription factor E3-like isoform X2 [Dendronephthya gigantea]